ncbi:hypothetical protein [Pseudoxanthomonas winnipegensis]|uniref:Uncharacterized protein n=1 Tax=Pseudoxanthomonas winnipegensis TaxID=2480810 RepID=A0A4Q8LUE3_9GAMM|nr:hypothetical protein [Pseudoxanthomonas winnipegensis]RZZ88376.1 hypothetical protein EA663_05985 [Pseudoxanthomonas winnipegensis]TAA34663.1 hypothetical protein EA656_13235 [Pseudoxanthomonas winnipegensis]
MKYNDGAKIELGDLVRLGSDLTGVVVGIIPERKFSSNYDPDEWGYLLGGVLVEALDAGLIHQVDTSIDFDLISRAAE